MGERGIPPCVQLATDMITLTISSSLPQFTQFLLERCGIEGNILTVDEARAAARHGSTWNDVVGVWKKRCPLEPEDESFVKLRTTLQALKKESPAAAPPAEPKAPPSPGTQRKLDELSSLGPAGMPNMLDEAKRGCAVSSSRTRMARRARTVRPACGWRPPLDLDCGGLRASRALTTRAAADNF